MKYIYEIKCVSAITFLPDKKHLNQRASKIHRKYEEEITITKIEISKEYDRNNYVESWVFDEKDYIE